MFCVSNFPLPSMSSDPWAAQANHSYQESTRLVLAHLLCFLTGMASAVSPCRFSPLAFHFRAPPSSSAFTRLSHADSAFFTPSSSSMNDAYPFSSSISCVSSFVADDGLVMISFARCTAPVKSSSHEIRSCASNILQATHEWAFEFSRLISGRNLIR